jgi:hypothetical protein
MYKSGCHNMEGWSPCVIDTTDAIEMLSSGRIEFGRMASADAAATTWLPNGADERWSVRRCALMLGALCAAFWGAVAYGVWAVL